MKRKLALLLAVFMVISHLTGCTDKETGAEKVTKTQKKLQVVTTIFPEYDWVMNILGENPADMEVSMLLDNGVDLHSYQPTTEDIAKIATCDLFVYVGGESDGWVEDALKESSNENMRVINLLDVLGNQVKEEEVVEGMEHDHGDEDHDHDGEHHDDDHSDEKEHDEDHDNSDQDREEHHDEEHEHESDEHVWLSLKNASLLCDEISDNLCRIDEANADIYKKNLSDYKNRLNKLDTEYEKTVSASEKRVLVFGDRFPFRYMTDDYGITYYAAFTGCSAETEASFETVRFLAKKIDELGINSIITIDGSDGKIAKTIMENTAEKNQKILTMNSMQSTTAKDAESGTSYISTMEDNLSVLKEALK